MRRQELILHPICHSHIYQSRYTYSSYTLVCIWDWYLPVRLFILPICFLRSTSGRFPGCSVVKNLPANARCWRLTPDPGRSHRLQSDWAHAPQLLSPCVAAPKAQASWSLLHNESNHCNEKSVHTAREYSHSPQLEESPHSNKDPAQLEINKSTSGIQKQIKLLSFF